VCIGHERLQEELSRAGKENGEKEEEKGSLGLYGSTESYSGDSK
jgi:hypothetical protein